MAPIIWGKDICPAHREAELRRPSADLSHDKDIADVSFCKPVGDIWQ